MGVVSEEYCQIRKVISDSNKRIALLIGNGLSINFWDKFKYQNLLDVAYPEPSQSKEKDIFRRLNTTNFEEALYSLQQSLDILNILGVNSGVQSKIATSYDAIKVQLVTTLQDVHPAYEDIPDINRVLDEIRRFQRVYTTNYDLLIYWALNLDQTHFTDRLRLDDDGTWEVIIGDHYESNRTHVYFIHGALHLIESASGVPGKLVQENNANILTRIAKEIQNNRYPLYVSEGMSKTKLDKIKSNPYLHMCYSVFSHNKALDDESILPLVVYGHSLNDRYDKHIIDAIEHSRITDVYYGIYDNQHRSQIISHLDKCLPNKRIYLYNALKLFPIV